MRNEGQKAIILAGGFGERTGKDIPKLLIQTKDGKTIFSHMFDDLKSNGLTPIIVTNGRFYPDIFSYIGRNYPDNISVINNQKMVPEERLGALGDLLYAIDKSNLAESDSVLVMPSDTAYWESFLIGDFLEFAQKHPNDFITVVHDMGDKEKIRKNLGCVILGEEDKIIEFEEKPENPKSTLAIVAIYLFRPEHLKLLRQFKKEGGNLNSPSNIIPYLTEKGVDIFAFKSGGPVIDANSPEEIEKTKNYGSS